MSGCWSCGSDRLETFFTVDEMALSSLILVDRREDAADFPAGAIEMVICARCGFMFNRAFRPELVDYTMPYESSQVFSPRFRAFADELIAHLIDSYDLEAKEILEIGCGDASFLQELCRQARARGYGIDPTYDESRIGADVDVRGISEFFDEGHTHLTADLICCRHTLEHIQPVAKFVGLARESATRRPGSVVFFEIPDSDRILEEGAFWDIYNEHCSYFTEVSLDFLFRSQGFEVLRLIKGFDDQYLLIDARPGKPSEAIDTVAVDHLVEKARRFGETAIHTLEGWRELVDRTVEANGEVVLWGASSKAVAFLAALDRDDAVTAAVDINPFKQDKYLPGSGIAVIRPQLLSEIEPELVIIMNPIYIEEITSDLASLGLSPRVEALGEPSGVASS
jgi:hypothetical protein